MAGPSVVEILGAIGTFGGFVLAGIAIALSQRTAASADRRSLDEDHRKDVDMAAQKAARLTEDRLTITINELKADLSTMTADRDYWRTRADNLSDLLNHRKDQT